MAKRIEYIGSAKLTLNYLIETEKLKKYWTFSNLYQRHIICDFGKISSMEKLLFANIEYKKEIKLMINTYCESIALLTIFLLILTDILHGSVITSTIQLRI